MSGKKYDSGKVRVGLVLKDFADALYLVASVATYGEEKYGSPSGWKEVDDALNRYNDAKGRHMLEALIDPDSADPESGIIHMAHEAWNSLATLQLHIEGKVNATQKTLD